MAAENPRFFSDVSDPTIERFIILSDVHGDIDAFVVNLRDNARIISKMGHRFDPDVERDEDMVRLLNLDLNHSDNEDSYNDSLNYRWIGGTTHLIICGDMMIQPEIQLNILKRVNPLFACVEGLARAQERIRCQSLHLIIITHKQKSNCYAL